MDMNLRKLVPILFFLLIGKSFTLQAAVVNGESLKSKITVFNELEKPTKPKINAQNMDEFIFYSRKYISSTLTKNRQVLLTFDDGPNPETTPKILDILKEKNLKAIFFMVGMNVAKYPQIVKRVHEEGHTIGNHSYYHINMNKFSQDRIIKEIRSTNDLIEKITGVQPTVFRPPYGALSKATLATLRQENMNVMLWSIDPRDWRSNNSTSIIRHLKHQMRLNQDGKGGIVLFHDTKRSTALALPSFLESLAQHDLLPMAFSNDSSSSGKRFWKAMSPRNLPWRKKFILDFAVIQRPILAQLLEKSDDTPSVIDLLKARRSGSLLKLLLCRNF